MLEKTCYPDQDIDPFVATLTVRVLFGPYLTGNSSSAKNAGGDLNLNQNSLTSILNLTMNDEEKYHQEMLAEALNYFINTTEEAVNGIIIWVGENKTPLRGKLVFEIEGKLSLEEAYRQKMQKMRNLEEVEDSEVF